MVSESPAPAVATDRDVSLAIRADIREHLSSSLVLREDDESKYPYAPDDYDRAYIKFQDIKEAWSLHGRDTIAKAFYPARLTSEYVVYVRENLLIFLSVLVWLDAHDQLDRFREYLKDRNGYALCSNNQLPLKIENVPDFGNQTLRKRFWREQYIFTPVNCT